MNNKIAEGQLYKELTLHGKTFRLYYGYYDENERQSKYGEPIPIYPDFLTEPVHTADGHPFVTAMQDTCAAFRGGDSEGGCHGCAYYKHGEDLIGLCVHEQN